MPLRDPQVGEAIELKIGDWNVKQWHGSLSLRLGKKSKREYGVVQLVALITKSESHNQI